MRKESVVTPERFRQGLTYDEYVAGAQVNQDRFHQFYEMCTLSPEDAEFFRRLVQHPRGPARVLVLSEDWCPDCYRGVPVMARIAEASGMELRVFPRDQNLDIMDEFLKDGQFRSIPTFVFYTRDHQYLCHWIERPALANRDRAEIEAQVRREMPTASDEEVRAEIRRRTRDRYPAWIQETVRELKDLLSQALEGERPS